MYIYIYNIISVCANHFMPIFRCSGSALLARRTCCMKGGGAISCGPREQSQMSQGGDTQLAVNMSQQSNGERRKNVGKT